MGLLSISVISGGKSLPLYVSPMDAFAAGPSSSEIVVGQGCVSPHSSQNKCTSYVAIVLSSSVPDDSSQHRAWAGGGARIRLFKARSRLSNTTAAGRPVGSWRRKFGESFVVALIGHSARKLEFGIVLVARQIGDIHTYETTKSVILSAGSQRYVLGKRHRLPCIGIPVESVAV